MSPEPLVCWCNGQSLESRYSSSTASEAFAALPRDQVRVAHGGNATWRRLDILAAPEGIPRSCTMMVSGLGGGRKRLQQSIDELQSR